MDLTNKYNYIVTTEEEMRENIKLYSDINRLNVYKIGDKYVKFRKSFGNLHVIFFKDRNLKKMYKQYVYTLYNAHQENDFELKTNFFLNHKVYFNTKTEEINKDDGPAIITYYISGTIMCEKWYTEGKLNNFNGPAIITYCNGNIFKKYFINDLEFDFKKYERFINQVKNGTKAVGRIKNKELLEAIEKTAKYFNSEKTLEKINTRKVILKLENVI